MELVEHRIAPLGEYEQCGHKLDLARLNLAGEQNKDKYRDINSMVFDMCQSVEKSLKVQSIDGSPIGKMNKNTYAISYDVVKDNKTVTKSILNIKDLQTLQVIHANISCFTHPITWANFGKLFNTCEPDNAVLWQMFKNLEV